MAGRMKHDRREFLGGTLATAAACFGTGLREALAQAKAAGKPLLTVDNLNSLIDTHHRKGRENYQALLKASKGNHIAFLQTHFHLTDRQVEELKRFTPIQLETLESFVESARKHGEKLQVVLTPPIIPPHAVSLESSGGDHPPRKVLRTSSKREEWIKPDISLIFEGVAGVWRGLKGG